MRGAVLAALAVCAAEGAVAQVPLKGTAGGNYSTPQDWVIPCIPGLLVSAYVSTPTPLTLGGLPFGAPGGRSVACNASQQMVLSFRPDPQAEGTAQRVEASWVIETPTAEPATSTATDVPPGTYTPLTVALVADAAASDTAGTATRLNPVPQTSASPTSTPDTDVPPPTATVHYMSDHGSISSTYRTSQKWVISCPRYSTLVMDIQHPPSGYTLKIGDMSMLDGSSLYYGYDQRVSCPYSEELFLVYTPTDGDNHSLKLSWSIFETLSPPTPSPPTVHYMSYYGSISSTYSTPQEWVISCTPSSTLWMDIQYEPSGYSLTLDGTSLSHDRYLGCPYSGKVSLVYTPSDGHSHTVRLQWYRGTAAPMWLATLAPPAPSPATVHHMSDHDSVDTSYSTPQEWVISCTQNSTLVMDIQYSPSGYSLKLDGRLMSSGDDQRVSCPSSGKLSLLYTPSDGHSHTLKFKWHTVTSAPNMSPTVHAPAPRTPSPPSPASVHYMSEEDSVHSSYSSAQEWVISCTPYRYVDVTVTQVAGTLTASTTTLYPGQRSVHCPSTGQMKLSYTPYSDSSQPLIVRWAPEGQAHTSKSLSPLLIVVIAAAGVLALVGVTVAVYCRCRAHRQEPCRSPM